MKGHGDNDVAREARGVRRASREVAEGLAESRPIVILEAPERDGQGTAEGAEGDRLWRRGACSVYAERAGGTEDGALRKARVAGRAAWRAERVSERGEKRSKSSRDE